METCHDLYRLIHQSQLTPNLHPRYQNVLHYQNVLRYPSFAMPLRGPILTLRRITSPEFHFRLTQASCITNQFASLSHHRMAEESKNKDVVQEIFDPKTTLNGEEKDKATEKSKPTLPPPPEKPLPGDCCGSGCVRCVWDVYYDEVEEYNRLCKPDSKDP